MRKRRDKRWEFQWMLSGKKKEMVIGRPAVLMQAVNMTVFDPSKIFPSTKKEKQVRVRTGDDV